MTCETCGAVLEQPTHGRRRRFCSDVCKQRAYRVTKCEGEQVVPPEPPRASDSFPRAFATFSELDAYLGVSEE